MMVVTADGVERYKDKVCSVISKAVRKGARSTLP